MTSRFQVTTAAIALLAAAPVARAQDAATVPASSQLYDRLETITAWYPTDRLPLGIRPVSRGVFREVVAELRQRIASDSLGDPRRRRWAEREIGLVERALGESRDGFAVRGALEADVLATSAPADSITSNSLGQINAWTHPFGDLREGRETVHGFTQTVLPVAAAGYASRVAAAVQPRLTIRSPDAGNSTASLDMHRAYVRGVYRNVALRIGPDEQLWGQSTGGALFVSGNAMPLRAVTIGTDRPFILPWVFRHAGPVTLTTMIADLGRAQDPRHAKMAGWHATMQPWSRFELGVSVLAQQGGEGGPEATLLQRFIDLLPLIDALAPQRADLTFSNKLAGGNLRMRFPEFSGLDVYYELMIDDFDLRRFESTVIDDFSHLLGARLPLLVGNGLLVARAELHNTSLRVYEHSQYLSGVTFRQHIIGSPMGPNAKGARAMVTWQPTPTVRLGLSARDEGRDPSLYASTSTGPFDEDFTLIRTTELPRQHRRAASVSLESLIPGGALRAELGYVRSWRRGEKANGDWGIQIGFRTGGLAAF